MGTVPQDFPAKWVSVRILVLTSFYPPYFRGGAELSCQNHVEGLQARGHQVFVLTSQWGVEPRTVVGNIYRLLDYDRTNLTSDCAGELGGSLRLRRRYDQFRRALSLSKNYDIARALIATVEPNVVYAWQLAAVSIRPALAAQDRCIPVVFRLPDHWLAQLRTEICLEPNPLKRWYRAVLSGGFDHLDTGHMLPNSHALMQVYLQAGFSASSMHVIPNGVPADLLLDLNDQSAVPSLYPNRDVRLLFVGRLVSDKGPDVAIRTLGILMENFGYQRARLDIIGEGSREYEARLRDMVIRLGLEESVAFVGRLEHSKVIELYSQYDILLFPSRWVEPFGRSMLEAMARGLPVVATNRGGPAEVIVDGKTGLLVPPDDALAMAMAVKRLLLDSELTQTIRCNALATLRREYSLERIIGQVEDYLQLVSMH